MKRFLVVILSLLYMASAMGATVEFHYCMGRNMGANFVHKHDDKCRKCGMHKSKSKGCCHDEQKVLKTSEHQLSKGGFKMTVPVFILPAIVQYNAAPAFIVLPGNIASFAAHAPPDISGHCPAYIVFRNLRV